VLAPWPGIETGELVMTEAERRKLASAHQGRLKRELNDNQLTTLSSLEHFGWELKFIRHKLFQDPIAVVFDGGRAKFAVLELDGSLNESPGFDIRH
jgi:hypothetical protein